MQPTLALTALGAAIAPHRGGHVCSDGKWWNDGTGTRTPCPIRLHLDTAVEQVQLLGSQVADAATSRRHVDAVATALTQTSLAELSEENRVIWRGLATQAITALHHSLAGTDHLTERAAAGLGRFDG